MSSRLMAKVGMNLTEWKAGTEELNNDIQLIERRFQVAAAMTDNWSKNSNMLKARISSLNEEIKVQREKLDLLNARYQIVVKEQGEASKEAEELAKMMKSTSSAIHSAQQSIERYNKKLEETSRLSKATKAMDKFAKKTGKVGKALSIGVTTPLIAAGTAAYKYASDLTEAANKSDVTFGYMSKSVRDWADNSLESMGMARSTALDAVSLYGDMATSMGLALKPAAEMSERLVELSSDIASFKNVSLSQSQNALKSIFTGETETLKNLGIVMTETNVKAYALSKGIKTAYTDMSQAEKVQLRYDYVLETSKNAIGDYSRTQDEAAQQVRKLPEALKELGASFGENIAPVITPLITGLNNLIVSFGQLDDVSKQNIVRAAAIAAGIGPVTLGVSKATSAVTKCIKTGKALTAWLNKHSATAKAAAAAENANAAALTATNSAATGAAGGVTALGTAMKTAMPEILAVTAALAGIVAIAKILNNCEREINDEYDNLIQKSNNGYQKQIDNIASELETFQNATDEKISSVETATDTEIKNLSKKQKALKTAINDEKKAYAKAHKERLSQLEKEKEAQLAAINAATERATGELQAQIDALDAQTAAEDKAKEERENAEKLEQLKTNILNAKSITDREEAQKEYLKFVEELEESKTRALREQKKQQLQDEIDRLKDAGEAQQKRVNEEYETAKALEESKTTVAQEGFEERLSALDNYIEEETERLNSLKDTNLARIHAETDGIIAEYKRQIEELERLQREAEEKLEKRKKEALENPIAYKYKERTEDKDGISRNIFTQVIGQLIGAESKGFYSILPSHASGTDDFVGGLTWINEKGGEIVNLPSHAQIIPHDISIAAAREYGRQRAIENHTTNTTNNYTTQRRITHVDIGGHRVATVIEPDVSEIMAIKLEQRRRAGRAYK